MDYSIVINLTSPFFSEGLSGVLFSFFILFVIEIHVCKSGTQGMEELMVIPNFKTCNKICL